MSLLTIIAQVELPRWWRLGVIAIGAIILCSCKSMTPAVGHVGQAFLPANPPTVGQTFLSANPHARQARMPAPHAVQPAQHEFPSPALPPEAYYQNGPIAGGEIVHEGGVIHEGAVIHGNPSAHGAVLYGGDPSCPTCNQPGWSPPMHVGHGYCQPGAGCAVPCPAPCPPPQIPSDEWIVDERRCDASNRCPPDEYICDGGDQAKPVRVAPDYHIVGLDVEDTVAHFDTLDGRRLVEQSNKLCIYSPRFASVRQVRGVSQHEGRDFVGRIHQPEAPYLSEEAQLAFQYEQPVQPVGQIGTKQPTIFRERNAGVGIDNSESLIGLAAREQLLGPVEVLRTGLLDQADAARLAAAIDSAIVWTHDLGVIVQISGQRLTIDTHDTKLGEIVMVDHEGNPGMRIIKIASHKEAQSGDVIEFTLRFDNIGDEEVGNVTIVDNLTTRLEYVEDSQSCTPDATFLVEPNEGQSLALRWEILEPIPPGEGGVIKFKCRVR
jgi:uncharacterized repeat protein (TIGR01451 family)